MRWPILLLAACSSSHAPVQPPDPDAASTTDSSDEWLARVASGVALGSSTIAWSEVEAGCGLEQGAGCHGPGPMLTLADAQGQVSTLVTGLLGASAIAGDESGWFYIDDDAGAVMRVVAGAPVKFSGTTQPAALAVDASYVYWFEPGANLVGRNLVRASRTGDGSDATTIAHPAAFQGTLYAFAGDVWWWACTTTCEIHRASSQAPVRSGAFIVGADAGALYLLEAGLTWRLLAMASDGSTTTLLAGQPQQTTPYRLVASGGELFWSTGNGLFRATPGGTPTPIVTTGEVFAVTSTQILFDFTPRGFSTVPR